MENIKEMDKKKKLLPIILAAVALIVIIVIIVLVSGKDTKDPVNKKPGTGVETPLDQAGMIDPETGEPIEPGMDNDMEAGADVVEINPVLVDAVAAVEGANLISKEGKVITNEGVEIRTDVSAMAAEAPRQTMPLDKDNIPESVTKIEVSAAGFTPSEFKVKKGKPASFSLSSVDEWSHSLIFDDPKLQAVSIGVSAGETRATTFPAPTEAGEYTFQCGVPGHAGRGETGKMIVE